MGAGTLYSAIKRLLDRGWISEVTAGEGAPHDELVLARRRPRDQIFLGFANVRTDGFFPALLSDSVFREGVTGVCVFEIDQLGLDQVDELPGLL